MRPLILFVLFLYGMIMWFFFYDQGWLLFDGNFEALFKSTNLGMWLAAFPFVFVLLVFKVQDFRESRKSDSDDENID